jgi:hypothetical protein
MSISNINESVEARLKQEGLFTTFFEHSFVIQKSQLIDYQELIGKEW